MLFEVLVSLGRTLSQYRIFRPLVNFGKKYIYNARLKEKLQETDFPPEIWIENTNICNARCVMCPRESHTRKTGTMDYRLFEKLIREVALFKDRVNRLHLHNYGEPLLDKRLPDKIRLAKQLGIHHTYIVTNGSLLTPDVSRQLIEAGLDEFKVSFYGTDAETYNTTMRGLDFNKTLQNLRDFFALRKELGKRTPKIIIQYLPQTANKERTDDFFHLMKPLIDESVGDTLNIFHMHTYGGGLSTNAPLADPVFTCDYPWRTMVILHDGKVVLCCLDYNGVQVVGDVHLNSIRDIWNGPNFKKARSNFMHLKYNEYPICTQCDRIR